MTAIYKREVRSFFNSFIGWLFVAAAILMMGIYFTGYNMMYGEPNISYVLQSMVFLFLIMIPVLTMRILAEDRRLKTDQLILTAPVSVGKVVFGKYLALLTVFAIPVALLCVAPFALSFVGDFQLGVSYTALLAFFLYGALSLAIGMFLSSLTESVVIAAVLTFAVLFLGYLMQGLCSMISQTGNILTKALSAFDMIGRFDEMNNGSFYVPSVVYYVSCTLFVLFITTQSIHKRRYSVSVKSLRKGAYSLGSVVLAAVLTIAVNVLILQLPENMISLDVTSNKMYTLTEDTKDFVSNLSENVTIYVLANKENEDANLNKTIKKIEDLSGHITVKYVDPAVNTQFYSNYTSKEPTFNSLIIEGPERSRVIDYNDIYELEFDYNYYNHQVTGYDGEGQIMSALAYVTTDDMPKIYMVSGHGELEFERLFTQAIQKDNIEFEDLSLLQVSEIPDDAKALILNAPTSDYSEDDVKKVISYLDKGGNAIIVPTWTETKLTNFEKLLDYYKISLVDGMIIEGDSSNYYSNPFYIFPQINDDDITHSIYDAAVFAPYSRGLSYDDESEDIQYTALLESGTDSYSKVDLKTATSYDKSKGDIDGPFVISLKAVRSLGDGKTSSAVIVATENLFTQSADKLVPGNNVKLFSNMLSALVEHESSVSIPIKYYDRSTIMFPKRVYTITALLTIIVAPLTCLITGFVIWYRRRKK